VSRAFKAVGAHLAVKSSPEMEINWSMSHFMVAKYSSIVYAMSVSDEISGSNRKLGSKMNTIVRCYIFIRSISGFEQVTRIRIDPLHLR
jgi:hypothetical protein